MPVTLVTPVDAAVSLEACLDALNAKGFNPSDQDSRDHAAGWLARLAANRSFLGDLLVADLAQQYRAEAADQGYSPQVLLLRASPAGFMLRANLWPHAASPLLRTTDPAHYAYGLAHDHNFDFLTVGYFGPGYWSDYYEYDASQVTGWRGEPVPSLRFVERARLSPGRLLYYRASCDIHVQHPPDALSVSLNVLHCPPGGPLRDQYAFDLERRAVAHRLGAGASEAFLQIAATAGSEEGLDLIERFAFSHPSHRMRLSAWAALASIATDAEAVWIRAESSGSLLVAQEARMHLQRASADRRARGQSINRCLQDHSGCR